MMDQLNTLPVVTLLLVAVLVIVVDALLGVFKTFKCDEPNFDIRLLPKFLAQSIMPYIGGLLVLAIAAEVTPGDLIRSIYYPAAIAVILKFVAEINDKIKILFNIGEGPN